jgi:hypothetical protein
VLHWVTTRVGQHTIGEGMAVVDSFDTSWARPWTIDEVARTVLQAPLPAGLWLFSDLERFTPAQLALAHLAGRRMLRYPWRYRVLNPPHRVLRRLELLQRLSAEGINDFRAWSVHEVPDDIRLPAFVRQANDHRFDRADLYRRPGPLARRLAQLRRRPAVEEWIVVEWAGWRRPDGLFRKYGAFVIGREIVSRHLFAQNRWVVKNQRGASRIADQAAEREYILTNPHVASLRRVARLAGVTYGRIDYDLRPDGGLRVWEINTNPVIRAYAVDADEHRTWVDDTGAAALVHRLHAMERRVGGEPGPPLPRQFDRWVRVLRKVRPGGEPPPDLERLRQRRAALEVALANLD